VNGRANACYPGAHTENKSGRMNFDWQTTEQMLLPARILVHR